MAAFVFAITASWRASNVVAVYLDFGRCWRVLFVQGSKVHSVIKVWKGELRAITFTQFACRISETLMQVSVKQRVHGTSCVPEVNLSI